MQGWKREYHQAIYTYTCFVKCLMTNGAAKIHSWLDIGNYFADRYIFLMSMISSLYLMDWKDWPHWCIEQFIIKV